MSVLNVIQVHWVNINPQRGAETWISDYKKAVSLLNLHVFIDFTDKRFNNF